MRRLLVLGLLLLPVLAQANQDRDPRWSDDPEGDHNFMYDQQMDPHWRREHQAELGKLAALEARKRAAEKRRRKARVKAKAQPPAPHPVP